MHISQHFLFQIVSFAYNNFSFKVLRIQEFPISSHMHLTFKTSKMCVV